MPGRRISSASRKERPHLHLEWTYSSAAYQAVPYVLYALSVRCMGRDSAAPSLRPSTGCLTLWFRLRHV
jgi:hypothetical protein